MSPFSAQNLKQNRKQTSLLSAHAGIYISVSFSQNVSEASVGQICKQQNRVIDGPCEIDGRGCANVRAASCQQTNLSTNFTGGSWAWGLYFQVDVAESHLSYLPISALIDSAGKPITALFRQIPHGSIVELVRPNWNLKEKIGTNMNVSHVGFAFWVDGQLIFRHATSIQKHVMDVPLADYLYERLHSPTVKGINVQRLVEDDNC